MKRLILLTFGVFAIQVTYSQSVTEIRQMRLKAIDVFETYAATLSTLDVPNSSVKDNFMALFDSSAVVYNDILPDNQQQKVSPAVYYDKYVKLIKSYPVFTDLKLTMPVEQNGKWLIKIDFAKLLNVREKTCEDKVFSPEPFIYEMFISMEKNALYVKKESYSRQEIENGVNQPFINSKITSLMVSNPVTDWNVIKLNDENVNAKGLYYKGKKVNVDKQNSIFVNKSKFDINDFSLNPALDMNYKLIKTQDSCEHHFYTYSAGLLKNIIGLQISYIPANYGITATANNDSLKGLNISSYGMGISLVYSRLISKGKSTSLYFTIKPGYFVDVMKIKADTCHGKYHNEVRTDTFTLSNIRETDVFHSFDLPFGISLVKNIKKIALTADLGFWMNYTFKYTSELDTAKLIKSGAIVEPKGTVKDYKSFDYGMYLSIGAMFKLKNSWFIKLAADYRYAFTDRSTYNVDFSHITDKEQFKLEINPISKWHTNRLQLNIGLVRKF